MDKSRNIKKGKSSCSTSNANPRSKHFHFCTFSHFHFLSVSCSRSCCFVAIATKNGPADLRLKRDLIVLTTVITDDLESLRCIFSNTCLLCPALWTPLWGHQISLVKDLLFLFGKKKSLLALHADSFNIGHRTNLLDTFSISVCRRI